MDVGSQAQGPSTPFWHGCKKRGIPKRFQNKNLESNATPSLTKAKHFLKNMLRENKNLEKESDFSRLPSSDLHGSTTTPKKHVNLSNREKNW